jgi:Family of unknown function (DUF6084)
MPELAFRVEGVEPAPQSAAPQLYFKLRISQRPGDPPIQTIALRCQVRIEPARRRYSAGEQDRLFELFAEPARWGQTLRGLLWTNVSTNVMGFGDSIVTDLPVPCTADFNVAVAKYFYALEEGEIPLSLLFSGTIFYQDADRLQVAQIPWDKEATYRLPVSIFREAMDRHFPNSEWLMLQRDVFERLYAYRRRMGLTTWEQALERLLEAAEAEVMP